MNQPQLLRINSQVDRRIECGDMPLSDLVIAYLKPFIGEAIGITSPTTDWNTPLDWASITIRFFGWHPSRQEPKYIHVFRQVPDRKEVFTGMESLRTAIQTRSPQEEVRAGNAQTRRQEQCKLLEEIKQLLPDVISAIRSQSKLSVDWGVDLVLEFRMGDLFSHKLSVLTQRKTWVGFDGGSQNRRRQKVKAW